MESRKVAKPKWYPSIRRLCSNILLLSLLGSHSSASEIICKANIDCDDGLICSKGYCTSDVDVSSNPFAKGCLHTMAEREGKQFDRLRVCNSDDAVDIRGGDNCVEPDQDYTEIRIGPWNWESALALGWVYQIILSEIYRVPATIEGGYGKPNTGVSFYDRASRFVFPDFSQDNSFRPVDQLLEADRMNGDCSMTEKACAHVMPEVWPGDRQTAKPYQDEGKILEAELSGVNARYGLYIPAHTIRREPSFASYIGLKGEDKRELLANTFKQPTNWSDYCLLAESNCEEGDEIAARGPATEKEGGSYFVLGAFKGYFKSHNNPNCATDPTCTGNIVTPNCQWSIFTEAQLYWNNVTLTSRGPMAGNSGYGYSHMIQIYEAAVANGVDVFFGWWEPDTVPFKYSRSTDFSFHRVAFPNPSIDCLKYRFSDEVDRCSSEFDDRVGRDSVGSCDSGMMSFRKLFSNGFLTETESVPIELRSPALAVLKGLIVPPYSIENIFDKWIQLEEDDQVENKEREGVCKFVYENLDELLSHAPKGYPRNFKDVTYSHLSNTGYAVGSITLIVAICTAALVYKWRAVQIIKFAQVDVLYLITLGHAFIAISGITYSVSVPSDAVCTTTQWFMRLGYTLALVPLLIKVSAVNKLTRSGMACRRVEIDPNRFKKILIATVSSDLVFLILWTSIDMPKQVPTYEMDIRGEDGTVNVFIGCASDSVGWEVTAFVWEFFLLLSATVLTFQSREVIQELNESHSLAFMVYSHFIFVIARMAVYTMGEGLSDMLPSAYTLKISSLLLSFDALCTTIIYFGPKFYKVMIGQGEVLRRGKGLPVRGTNAATNRNVHNGNGGGGGSHISGIRIPRNSDGTVPSLIKPKSSMKPVSRLDSCESVGVQVSKVSMNIVEESIVEESIPLQDIGKNDNDEISVVTDTNGKQESTVEEEMPQTKNAENVDNESALLPKQQGENDTLVEK